jgi:hypothetical protein
MTATLAKEMNAKCRTIGGKLGTMIAKADTFVPKS